MEESNCGLIESRPGNTASGWRKRGKSRKTHDNRSLMWHLNMAVPKYEAGSVIGFDVR
jgi:hypothetical protein